MKLINKCYIILLLTIFFSCGDKKNVSNKSTYHYKTEDSVAPINGMVLIRGVSDDLEALENFNVLNLSTLSSSVTDYTSKKVIIDDSLYIKIDSICSPQLLHLFISGPQTYHNTRLIVNPNDTVTFEIKNKNLVFLGKKAAEYNFYNKLNSTVAKHDENLYRGSLKLYKKSTDSIYSEQLKFLNDYIEKHGIYSSSFINSVKSDLKYEHLSALLLPSKEGLIPVIQNEFQKDEVFFKIYEYIGDINLEDLRNENNLSLLSFRTSLFPLISNYFENSGEAPYTLEKMSSEKKFIDKNFNGRTREFIYSYMIFQYHQNGFGSSEKSQNSFKKLISEFESDYPNTPFTKIKEIKKDLLSFEMTLSESALNSKLSNFTGDTLTVREILKSSKKIKIMDFWASWCTPCIDEMKSATDFKDRLIIENDIQWIYISIDENQDNWQKKTSELKAFINLKNHYRVLKGKDSGLMKFLKISWIPRYVILNENDKIILNNAPRPSNYLVFKKNIEEIIQENESSKY